ncbi:hypothetical protein R3P38DRAFT_2776452 [Favolaschia claudopus]|uniref:Uncharacterized protein n=1 Tax=Favolaschia claudopus TaxID=2862362 RepID=A0AAW0BRF5_9AGAR
MHPALTDENLKKLPLTLRTLALEAYQGSRTALQEIGDLLSRRDIKVDRPLFLPIVFQNLRAPIQPEECLLHHPRAIAARLVLHFPEFINKGPREAFVEIWPRYWRWFQIFNPIDTLDPENQQRSLISLVLFLLEIFEDFRNPTSIAIVRTPELRIYVCRLWNLLPPTHIHDPSYTTIFKGIWAFLRYSCGLDESAPRGPDFDELQEFIDGAGGVADFAALVIRYIALFSGGRQQDVWPLESLFSLWGHIDTGDGHFRAEIISRGVVQLVVTALAAFQNLTVGTPFTCGLILIYSLLRTRPVYPWVKEAVKAGFLPSLMHYSMRREALNEPELLVEVITLLASSCNYPSVLRRLGASMARSGEIMDGPQFQHCPFHAPWLKFTATLSAHLFALNKFEASAPVTERACDNLDAVRKDTRQNYVSSLRSVQVYVLLLGYMPKTGLGWRQPSR